MEIQIIDESWAALERVEHVVRSVEPDVRVLPFLQADDAVKYAKAHHPEVAILRADSAGLGLARQLIRAAERINIIFVADNNDYLAQAWELRASGYILRPVTESKLRLELEHLRNPPQRQKGNRLYIRAFGNFEVYAPLS